MAVDLSLSYGLNCISSIHMYSLGVNFFGHRAFKGFPGDSVGKESPCNAGDLGFIPRRSPGEGKGYPLQYYGLESSMDCIVNGVAKSWTQVSNFHFHWWFTGKKRNSLKRRWFLSVGWKIPWRRKWQSTLVFLPRKFHRQRNLVGYSPWGPKESDMTEHAHRPFRVVTLVAQLIKNLPIMQDILVWFLGWEDPLEKG